MALKTPNGYFIQICPICLKPCKARNYWRSITALRTHIKKKHGENIEYSIIKCPECNYKAVGKYQETLHKARIHMISTHHQHTNTSEKQHTKHTTTTS
jgi:hypothetical protein